MDLALCQECCCVACICLAFVSANRKGMGPIVIEAIILEIGLSKMIRTNHNKMYVDLI